jgi:superfamily II DNA/RNA helicase
MPHRNAADELDVHVTPYSTARPVRTFAQLGLDKRLLAEIFAAGYERPTPIQAQTVPIVLSGSDVIALAKTGTARTTSAHVGLSATLTTTVGGCLCVPNSTQFYCRSPFMRELCS